MKNKKIAHSLMAIVLGTALASSHVLAEESLSDKASSVMDSTGAKIDSSIKDVGNYLDDSAITTKVKNALIEDKSIENSDISVKTENGVVILSGFVNQQVQAEHAVAAATKVEGVKSVSDKLHVKDNKLDVKDNKSQSIAAYSEDATTTGKVKAKLLTDDISPSRKIKVETNNGVVQLSGDVNNKEQFERAESIAKTVDGVKSVKNDLNIKP